MKELLQRARQLGIYLEIKLFNGNGYHYYDEINNCIMLDNTADEITIEDIVHEYVHSIQYHERKEEMMYELDNYEYDARAYEYHAEIVCTHIDNFIINGQLNTKEIINYYDDIVNIFYEK